MAGVSEAPAQLGEVDAQGVRVLTLERPQKANALSHSLVEGLHAALDRVGGETRVLVVRGAGKHFCGGFDFEGYEAQSEGDLMRRFVRIEQLLGRLRYAPWLSVAWVQGAAYGAGADIACACTLRLGTAAARFRFPGFQFGVALGTRRLAGVAGQRRAREILSRNEALDAGQAQACGILHEVLDEDAPDRRVGEVSRGIAGLDGEALRTLLALTEPDTRDSDLADLVRSVARPGLHARIARYRGASG